MKVIAVIPARYNSTRIKNKPLIQINGEPLIKLTYTSILKSELFDKIYITTDSIKIKNLVQSFGAECMMTSETPKNGTERCAEMIKKLTPELRDNDLIVNIQCDEPFIAKKDLIKIINLFQEKITIGTLISELEDREISDKSVVKTIIDNKNYAIDFSRNSTFLDKNLTIHKHIGVYAYTKKVLLKIAKSKVTEREINESLEQLRWIKHNYQIKCGLIDNNLISINTENDLKKVQKKNS